MAEASESLKNVSEVSVNKLFARFSNQIEALERELKAGGIASNMSPAQRLPRHLRRRAASHNPKRVPRSVREKFAEARAKLDASEKNKKKPCRRYRRKPANLRAVYLKRQARIRWLQTHIWHAKRFHIVERWGFRLPNFANDKGRKSSIRALKTEAIMMDISFSSIIEITGPKSNLIDLLSKFVPEALGRPFAQKTFWTGARHCSAILYDPGKKYPNGALGHCSILLAPNSSQNSAKIWLTAVHPLLVKILLEKVQQILGDNSSVKAEEVSEHLSTFRFFGLKTHSVLALALNLNEKQIFDRPAGFFAQEVVDDPRPLIPIKIRPILSVKEAVETRKKLKVPGFISLFDSENRVDANKSRIPDHLVSSRRVKRSEKEAPDDTKLAKIPIILARSANFCDVIVPAQWATAFWIGFVYNGARTGGLRELESLSSEVSSFAGSFHLNFFPDCDPSAKCDAERVETELLALYLRRPPAKRANYRKLAILRPFHYSWRELVQFWHMESALKSSFSEDFYVLREFSILREIGEDVSRKLQIRREIIKNHLYALVPIEILAKDGGTPQPFSLICLPCQKKGEEHDEEPIHDLDETWISADCRDPTFTFRLNSRKIIGFLVSGGYSFVRGHGRGIGFVSVLGLDVLLRCRSSDRSSKECSVEFRSASERKYWTASLQIVTNVKL